MAEQRVLDPAFAKRWGIETLAPAKPDPAQGQRSLDVAEFERKWLTAQKPEKPNFDTDNWTSTTNALTGGLINGVPIVGPPIKAGAERAGAWIRSKLHGTKFDDELAQVRGYSGQSAEDHPIASTAGEITGAVAPMVAAAGIPAAASLLGMAGGLPARVAMGGATNALIGGADAAVRSGGDLEKTAMGAGVGGAFGAGAPFVGRAMDAGINRMLRPAGDAVTNRLLAIANREGIPIGAQQATESPWLAKVGQMAGQFPGSGQRAFQNEQIGAFTRAVGRSFGEDADNLTPQVMKAAKRRIGKEFDHVAANTTTKFDDMLGNRLMEIADDARNVLPESEVGPIYAQIRNIMQKHVENGDISGKSYQALTRTGAPLDRAKASSNSNVSYYAGLIRDALDDAMERSATPEMAQRLAAARYQYKNLMTVAPLVVKGIPGEVSPLSLQSRVNVQFGDRAFGGGGDLGELADVGQRFFRQPRDSGTPLGNKVIDTINQYGNMIGTGMLAGAVGIPAFYGASPEDIAKPTLGLVGGALAARGLTSVLNRPQVLNQMVSRAPIAAPYLNAPTGNLLLNRPEAAQARE